MRSGVKVRVHIHQLQIRDMWEETVTIVTKFIHLKGSEVLCYKLVLFAKRTNQTATAEDGILTWRQSKHILNKLLVSFDNLPRLLNLQGVDLVGISTGTEREGEVDICTFESLVGTSLLSPSNKCWMTLSGLRSCIPISNFTGTSEGAFGLGLWTIASRVVFVVP